MQARIPNADCIVAVAADANDTPERNDSAYYSYNMFGQMPDSGLPRKQLPHAGGPCPDAMRS
jgi:hypothetical protein